MKTTEYKDSEVGRIPADWKVAQLKDLTDIISGATPSTSINEYWNGDIPWMSSGELNMKLVRSVNGRITQKGYDSCGTHMIPPLCVLIGLAGQGKTRGTAAINYIPLCTNQSIASILPSSYFDSFFLFYWLDNQYYNLRMLSAGDGGRGGLNKQLLLNLWVPLPPLKEQNAIANSLSSIDSLIFSLDELIEKKRMIKEGLMQELLTGKKRLRGFSGEWVSVKLGAISNISTGKRNGDEQVENGKFPFFVRSQIVYSIDSYSYDGEAILVPGEGSIGKIFHYINGKFDFHQRVYKISDIPDNYCTKFIYYYMTRFFGSYAMQNTVKATVDSLRLPVFLEFEMNLPPRKDEQCAIAHTFDSIVNDIATLESQRNKYLLIKHGMMQQLLTGKTRL